MMPASRGGRHFGGRIVFARDGTVFLTLGDRGSEERAQKSNDHAGSVIRLHDDGRIPADNPFVSNKAHLPESFSRGNHNIQGAALHPKEERLLVGEVGRVTDVRQGPDGYLYLLTESSDAALLRIEPK
jgi:glucose/arabinose dehydrogenase